MPRAPKGYYTPRYPLPPNVTGEPTRAAASYPLSNQNAENTPTLRVKKYPKDFTLRETNKSIAKSLTAAYCGRIANLRYCVYSLYRVIYVFLAAEGRIYATFATCMGDPTKAIFQDAKDFVSWLTGLTPASAHMLNPQEQQAHISRLVPYQPRVPLDEELQKQQQEHQDAVDAAEEAKSLAAERQQLAQQHAEAMELWYKQNTQGPQDPHPGALNSQAVEHRMKIHRAQQDQKKMDEAEMAGRPLNIQI